jgi:hypothetical protein
MHFVFVVGLLFILHQCIWGVIIVLKGDPVSALATRLLSLALFASAYVLFVKRRQAYLWPLLAFCVFGVLQLVLAWHQYVEAFPDSSFLHFQFLARQGAKCEIGDWFGCAYLTVDAYLLPVMSLLVVVQLATRYFTTPTNASSS